MATITLPEAGIQESKKTTTKYVYSFGGGKAGLTLIDENDPLPGMKQSFSYMRGVLAGIVATSPV